MQCNGNFKQWFNMFLIISEAWQGYESNAYGVSNHNLKLQSKKLSRTRDIPNFPTQGWADTIFCTHKRSETYIYTSRCWKLCPTLWKIHIWIAFHEQECIPVGCILPAAVVMGGSASVHAGIHTLGVGLAPPRCGPGDPQGVGLEIPPPGVGL